MITTTRNWLKRNRYPIALGAGIVGATYVAGQYVLGKIQEARVRMSDDRVAKENIRRRFAQNQEDCTYTILALLPTASENVVAALPVERITGELQARRNDRGGGEGKSVKSTAGSSELAPSEAQSTIGEESVSGSSGFVHASRMGVGEQAEGGEGDERMKTKSKGQLWNDVKIYSLTRAITLIYTLSLLTLLTRIQLNLLGRRSYLSSVVSLALPSPTGSRISLENNDNDASADGSYAHDYGSDFDTNRMYLAFSWWLLHRGWRAIMEQVESAVKEVFGGVTPRDNVSFGRFAEMVLEVRKRVEGRDEEERTANRWLPFVLPEQEKEEAVLRESGIVSRSSDSSSPVEGGEQQQQQYRITPSLRRLLDETSDIVDSPTFSHVLTLTLDAQFSLLVDDKIAEQAYKIPPSVLPQDRLPGGGTAEDLFQSDATLPQFGESRIQEVDDDESPLPTSALKKARGTTCKLATTLAVFTRQAHVIGHGGDLNSFMAASPAHDIPGFAQPTPPSLKDANEYLATVDAVRDLEAFAAVVYSSNFELEGVENLQQAQRTDEKVPTAAGIGANIVDAGKEVESSLESAWGKAVSSVRT